MKKMKNILALLFCAALAVIVTPSIVHAEVISDNGVSVLIIGHAGCTHDLSELNLPDTSTCHTHVMSSYRYDSDINAKSGDGWSYDVASRTLTLDGFNGSGLWFESTASEDSMLTVKLIGDNTVNGLQYGSEPHGSYYAMGGAWADWDIQGPGSLTVDAYQGIYPTILGGDGLLHISNGAVINVNTYRVGLAADEMIIDSGCVVIANTTKPDDMIEGVVVASNPVATQHTRCNGTLITTNANPGGNGIQSAAFLTAGPNVTLNAGTSAADASARTISSMPSEEYGADTGRFYYEDDYPYMAMIEAGYNGAATVTAPPVTAPTTPVTTLPATVPTQSGMTVMPTPSKVFVNGVETSFEAYNIEGSNYFKLRDLAFVLSGSQKQFDVGFDSVNNAIALTSGVPYTVTGGEMAAGDGQAKPATPTTSKIYLNGGELSLTVYNIGGNNFFKLVDLMNVLNIGVTYNQTTGNISIDTNAGFTGVVTVS